MYRLKYIDGYLSRVAVILTFRRLGSPGQPYQ